MHQRPLSNTALIIGFLGIIMSLWLWQYSISWGFTLLLFFLIVSIAAYVSVLRRPFSKDVEIELAIHEKYRNKRYPDTDLHEGLIPEEKIESISPHRRVIRRLLREKEKKITKKATKKKATKKSTKKKTVKKTSKKTTRKTALKKASKATKKKTTKKATKKKTMKKSTKKKTKK